MIALALVAALIGAAHAPTDPAAQAVIDTPMPVFPSSAAIFNPGVGRPGDHLLCHYELEAGSRFGHTICLTREDWAFLAANGQGFLEFLQNRAQQFALTRNVPTTPISRPFRATAVRAGR